MLCLIFTGTKMLAGVQGEPNHLLDFGGQNHLSYSDGLWAGFQQHFPTVEHAYHLYQSNRGTTIDQPISLILLLPLNTSIEEKNALLDWIKSKEQYGEVVYIGSIAHHYIKSLQKDQLLGSDNCIVLNALGAELSTSSIFSEPNTKPIHQTLPNLGWRSGKENIVEYLVTQLAQEGFLVGPSEVLSLQKQVAQTDHPIPFHIDKKSSRVEVSTSITIAATDWKTLLVQNHSVLQKLVNEDWLKQQNISKLILIGKYFENDIILNYICNDLKLQPILLAPDLGQETKVFHRLIDSAFDQAITIYATLSEVRQQINHQFTDSSTISKRPLKAEIIKDKTSIRVNNPLTIPKTFDQEKVNNTVEIPIPIHPINNQTESNYSITDLEKYFQLDDIYSTKDYLFFKGKRRDSDKESVIRFMANDAAQHPKRIQGFRQLHEMENSYYEDISAVQTLPIGQFYTRSFINFEGLHKHIKINGIYKKQNINQLNTNDLNLVLHVFQEINGLKFACKNMQVGNILVQSKLKWNLSRTLSVRLVGFNIANCSKAEMIHDIHKVFERQIGQQLYSQIRDKFKL